jgi:hypothetical protein
VFSGNNGRSTNGVLLQRARLTVFLLQNRNKVCYNSRMKIIYYILLIEKVVVEFSDCIKEAD